MDKPEHKHFRVSHLEGLEKVTTRKYSGVIDALWCNGCFHVGEGFRQYDEINLPDPAHDLWECPVCGHGNLFS